MSSRVEKVTRFHRKAMKLADESIVARLLGNREEYLRYTKLALEKEAAAADLMADEEDIEPTRSILHRSAATLAWRCQEYDRAKRLIYRALAGRPSPDIEDELHDLLGKVRLALSGARLTEQEIVLTMEGNGVAHNTAPAVAVASRIAAVQDLILCMVKNRNRAAHAKIHNARKLIDAYPLYLEDLSAGSFNAHMRIGRADKDILPGFSDLDEIASPLIQYLQLLEDGEYDALQEAIAHPADYQSFVAAAKELAPDGDAITAVTLQARIDGQTQSVVFKRSKTALREAPELDIPKQLEDFQKTAKIVTKKGVLKSADSLGKRECLLITDGGARWRIEFPTVEILNEIAQNYFNKRVSVTGNRMKKIRMVKRIYLANETQIKAI